MQTSALESLVTFRGGRLVPLPVLLWMQDVQRRGGRFTIAPDGAWRVTPVGTLTIDDVRFMHAQHRWGQILRAIPCVNDELAFRDYWVSKVKDETGVKQFTPDARVTGKDGRETRCSRRKASNPPRPLSSRRQ